MIKMIFPLKFLKICLPNLFIIIISLAPFFFPKFFPVFLTHLIWSVLYFWAIYCPEKISLIIIYGASLLQENFLGLPSGILGCLYLVFWYAVTFYRKYIFEKSFLTSWIGFTFFYSLFILIERLFEVRVQYDFNDQQFVFETAAVLLIYPIMAKLCFDIYKNS